MKEDLALMAVNGNIFVQDLHADIIGPPGYPIDNSWLCCFFMDYRQNVKLEVVILLRKISNSWSTNALVNLSSSIHNWKFYFTWS